MALEALSSIPINPLACIADQCTGTLLFEPASAKYKRTHATRLEAKRQELKGLGCKITDIDGTISEASLSVFYMKAANYRAALGEEGLPLCKRSNPELPITGAPLVQESPPTVMIALGSGSVAEEEIDTLGAVFLDRGFDILTFNYSGHGESAGKPSEMDCYCNVYDIYLHAITVLEIPTEKLVGCGNSLGGATILAALDLDASIPLILDRTFSEMGDVCASFVPGFLKGAVKYLVKNSIPYDSVSKIEKATGDVLILRGTGDSLIPTDCAAKLKDAAGSQATVLDVSGEHAMIMGPTWETEKADQDAFSAALEEMTLSRKSK